MHLPALLQPRGLKLLMHKHYAEHDPGLVPLDWEIEGSRGLIYNFNLLMPLFSNIASSRKGECQETVKSRSSMKA